MQTMERICKDNIEAHDKKYSALLDKLESLAVKTSSVEKENADLRGNLKHINHTTTLEKELLKAEMDSKCKILKQQCDTQSETILKLNQEIHKSTQSINEQSDKIITLENTHKSLQEQIEKKDQEIISLKIHNSRDDSTDFQEVRSQSTHSKDNTQNGTHSQIPQVTIIGTSNTRGINPDKLSSRFKTDKILAYTINDAETEVRHLPHIPEVLVFHSTTNDLKTSTPSDCVSKMEKLINLTTEMYPRTKVIISLPTPRSDNSTINHNAQITSVMLKEKFKDTPLISTFDNSNLAYKREPRMKFIDQNDGYHLSSNGTSLLASNIRAAIDKALELPKLTYRSFPQIRGRGNPGRGRGNRQNRWRGRGGYGY